MKAVLLVSHGSRSRKSHDEVVQLADWLKQHSDFEIVQHAFLDVDQPTIPEAIKLCADQGARQVIVLLNFLNSGNHVLKAIPALIEQARQKYPTLSFQMTPHIGASRGFPQLFGNLLAEAAANSPEQHVYP